MSTQRRRLDGLAADLTPTQRVLRWLGEALPQGSLERYVAHLRGQPATAWPLYRLPDEAAQAVRKALKGQPGKTQDREALAAVRDVVFLWYLHQLTTTRVGTGLQCLNLHLALLLSQLARLLHDSLAQRRLGNAWMRACDDLPYPLDRATAGAVRAALAHRVETWASLRDVEVIDGWVLGHFEAAGRRPLPAWAFAEPAALRHRRAELCEVFGNASACEAFLAGEDFQHGLVDVPDRGFEAKGAAVERALRRLVRSRAVAAGAAVTLPTVPHPFLREAPLVEGRWLDQFVLELAETGAALRAQGYEIRAADDDHPLAWACLGRRADEGNWQPVEETAWAAARAAAQAIVKAFRGPRRKLAERPYVDFSTYCGWRRRRGHGALDARTADGLVAASWNAWVVAQGDEATLGGVAVASLEAHVDEAMLTVHEAPEARQRQATREDVLRALRPVEDAIEDRSDLPEDRSVVRAAHWRDHATTALRTVEGLAGAVAHVQARYFHGHDVIYPDLAGELAQVRAQLADAAASYNDYIAGPLDWLTARTHGQSESSEAAAPSGGLRVDLEAAKAQGAEQALATLQLLVDQAKFEAHTFVGERDAAQAIISRRLDAMNL